MKADRIDRREVVWAGERIAAEAVVEGAGKQTVAEGRRLLSLRLGSRVSLTPPKSVDLSSFNGLVLHLCLARPFEGSGVLRFEYGSRSPGMERDDERASVFHFNQPRRWKGFQRVVIPAENLVATGFPDGWRGVRRVTLDLHSRTDDGWVILGDVEAMAIRRPQGPRMSDEELLEALDFDRPDLRRVARHARAGRTEQAVAALAGVLRRTPRPPCEKAKAPPHYPMPDPDELCRHLIMEQQLPAKIDWQCNPAGYLEWNHHFNRQTWLGVLSEAAIEADGSAKGRRYARKLDYFVRSWIEQNPEPVGHNGGLDPAWETLSTACRMNWAWLYVLHAARRSDRIADRTLVDMAKMIHAHAEHLLAYGGHYNWRVAESTAILAASVFVPQFRRADRWATAAIRRLQAEMRKQVFPDGVQFELSPGYHGMCANLFYKAYAWARFAGRDFSAAYVRRLKAMFDYLASIARPDATFPVMNDAGCCLRRGEPSLAAAARMEKRSDWLWVGSGGAEGRPPTCGSVHFPDAGYVVMRTGWGRKDLWAFMDMAEFGMAHQHEDKLQVELHALGSTFLVDPGISSYQHDPVVEHFRRTDAHNTLRIDGFGQARRLAGDKARFGASSRGANLWASGRRLDFAQGCYDEAYGDERTVLRGIVHTRALAMVDGAYWLILDSVTGSGKHEVEALWGFAPMHVRVDPGVGVVRTQRVGRANLELICRGHWTGAEMMLAVGQEKPVQGFVALDDEIKPAPCALVSRARRLPLQGVTVAAPFASGCDSGLDVTTRPVRAAGAAGWLIRVARPGGVVDRFLWRHSGRGPLTADGLRADGRLALVRAGADGAIEYAALMDGRSLTAGRVRLRGRSGRLVER